MLSLSLYTSYIKTTKGFKMITQAKQIRDILKENGIKRTQVNVTTGKGSMKGSFTIEIREKGFYTKVKSLFDFSIKSNLCLSCLNSLMD